MLWVDPSDTDNDPTNDVLIAAGITLWRSTDGGVHWTQISNDLVPGSLHDGHHVIVEHPQFNGGSNSTVFFGTDGGLYRTDNVYTVTIPTGWVNLNNGLAIAQFYGVARDAQSGLLIGGFQDAGVLRDTEATGPNSWAQTFTGNAGFCAIDPTDPNFQYMERPFLNVVRTTDGAASLQSMIAGLVEAGNTANWIAPLVMDPNIPNWLLGGGASLWRCTNANSSTPTWAATKRQVVTNNTLDLISAIAVDPTNSNTVWVGHNSGRLFRTTAIGNVNSWTEFKNFSSSQPTRMLLRIVIDPNNVSRIFLCYGGFQSPNLWVSTNGGKSFSPLSGLPVAAPVRDIEVNPVNSNWLYAATEVGLLVSQDNGVTWSSKATPANVPIYEMLWSGGYLYLATHGRGAFRQTPYPASIVSVGAPCRVGGPIAGPNLVSTLPILGQEMTMSVSGAVPGGVAAIWVSAVPPGPTQLSPGCFLQVNPAAFNVLPAFLIQPDGTGNLALDLANSITLAGTSLMTQAIVLSVQGQDLSNGLQQTYGF